MCTYTSDQYCTILYYAVQFLGGQPRPSPFPTSRCGDASKECTLCVRVAARYPCIKQPVINSESLEQKDTTSNEAENMLQSVELDGRGRRLQQYLPLGWI